ncbi:MAG: hypothetical protein A3C44_02315 [Gammaproteobacteria bacterium RIFCSPHIGHO2_02_FULL_39_13]|nr:MAG: hypothetical protein A3C44_02315 [Gammaproteobacteria bacterium RIFCSPHIGHO2_02_FULL_39_13]OGT48369.1 MAG: hypothetical protein A3E53_06010 [Gammaproteobacteria bacterium RIFCSPHIGHO2_12_FULL_39_24]
MVFYQNEQINHEYFFPTQIQFFQRQFCLRTAVRDLVIFLIQSGCRLALHQIALIIIVRISRKSALIFRVRCELIRRACDDYL